MSPREERFWIASYGAAFASWVVVYLAHFGPLVLLWFCCAANVLVMVGVLRRDSLALSVAVVSVLPIQLWFAVDLAIAAATGRHPLGGTEYVFDPTRPWLLRALTLHHVVTPIVALRFLAARGYDARAAKLGPLLFVVLLGVGHFAADPRTMTDERTMPRVDGVAFDRDYDVNFSHGLFGRPERPGTLPAWLLVLVGYPLVVHLPTHLALRRVLVPRRPA